jgi:hypothetical protein
MYRSDPRITPPSSWTGADEAPTWNTPTRIIICPSSTASPNHAIAAGGWPGWRQIRREYDNINAALRWVVERPEGELGLRYVAWAVELLEVHRFSA